MARELFAGVMSGTSLDGIDAVVADFAPASGVACETLGAAHVGLPTMLRDELLALQTPGANELARAGSAANMLAELYADWLPRSLVDRSLLGNLFQLMFGHFVVRFVINSLDFASILGATHNASKIEGRACNGIRSIRRQIELRFCD